MGYNSKATCTQGKVLSNTKTDIVSGDNQASRRGRICSSLSWFVYFIRGMLFVSQGKFSTRELYSLECCPIGTVPPQPPPHTRQFTILSTNIRELLTLAYSGCMAHVKYNMFGVSMEPLCYTTYMQ